MSHHTRKHRGGLLGSGWAVKYRALLSSSKVHLPSAFAIWGGYLPLPVLTQVYGNAFHSYGMSFYVLFYFSHSFQGRSAFIDPNALQTSRLTSKILNSNHSGIGSGLKFILLEGTQIRKGWTIGVICWEFWHNSFDKFFSEFRLHCESSAGKQSQTKND